MDKKIISYNHFLRLNEGLREDKKIDELLDILKIRKLTDEEKDLLKRLSNGEKLPPPAAVNLKKDKTGGLIFDENGNPIVQKDDEIKAGSVFQTKKGKNKISPENKNNILEARVYKNKNSTENFFFVFTSITNDATNEITPYLFIYRTGGNAMPIGTFMNDERKKAQNFRNDMPPSELWKQLDLDFDYGMILDFELYQDLIELIEIFGKPERNKNRITQIKNKFLKLL